MLPGTCAQSLNGQCQYSSDCAPNNCLNNICVTDQQVSDAQTKAQADVQAAAQAVIAKQAVNTGKKVFSVGSNAY